MSRYIDADALLESVKSKRLIFEESTPIEEAIAEQVSVFEEAIEEAPTTDVVEVRHGEWRIVDSDIGYVELECSLCRNKLLFNTDDGFTYCPNCGAKMDGERSEEK